MNKEMDYVTVIIPIHKSFVNDNLSIRDKIIDALNIVFFYMEKHRTSLEISNIFSVMEYAMKDFNLLVCKLINFKYDTSKENIF